MNVFFRALIISMFFSSVVMASEGTTTTREPEASNSSVAFQIIERQVVFNNDSIESAVMIKPSENAADDYSIQLELKTEATEQLGQLTQSNIGKQVNIVLNGVLVSSPIISSSLGSTFVLSGLTKEQATRFVEDVKNEN